MLRRMELGSSWTKLTSTLQELNTPHVITMLETCIGKDRGRQSMCVGYGHELLNYFGDDERFQLVTALHSMGRSIHRKMDQLKC